MLPRQARVIIDTNLVVQAYTRYTKHREHDSYPAHYQLVHAFKLGYFRWLWNEDILAEYQATMTDDEYRRRRAPRGGEVDLKQYASDERLIRHTGEEVTLSAAALAEARRLILSPGRPSRLKDWEDAVYLATADDGQADYLLSVDQSLLSMGDAYKGTRIVTWSQMLQELGYFAEP